MIDLADMKAIALRTAGSPLDAMPRLHCYLQSEATPPVPLIYDPVATLVLQGTKRTIIGDRVLEYGAGDCMIVAVEAAAVAQICQASSERPYLAFNLFIEPKVLLPILAKMPVRDTSSDVAFGFSEATPALIEAWSRYIGLINRPHEIPVLAPLYETELMYRLLSGPQGDLLRQIANTDTRLSRLRVAMEWIRDHVAEHLSVEAMAEIAGMSVSVFHRRFKAATGHSPLQYQKYIRLHEARQLLISGRVEAAKVAFAVGYESASQFSREYKRLFGAPPRRDTHVEQTAARGKR
ncbi:AraC family transcriptional regulator [Sphingomonas sp. BK235]|uniref:AraC family transcriptional regulator n=1 Tax=Sphingomonas sp. BK235 TaxID=2512131 RepID=UPI001043B860|nr:AraC family transcriptional regulator [Sphingomonas sp. BK235]TCP30119.1 AraC family transcriptional regulator [Sphingomonas sp. BK235]